MGKVTDEEVCKKFKFDRANKWYMHNPESVPENETHKVVWDFDIQTDHQISARRPYLVIVNKKQKTYWIVEFTALVDHRGKLKVGKKRDKYMDLAKELKKKIIEYESDGDTNCNKCAQNSHEKFGIGTGGLGNKRTSGDHPNDSTVKIGRNTEKNPEDLRRLAVTQTPVKDHQLLLVWKTLKQVK